MSNRTYPRIKTVSPGVFYRETKAGRVFYILYRHEGDRHLIEDRLYGKNWTEARAVAERIRRIEGKASNAEIKKMKLDKMNIHPNRPTFDFIWRNYLDCKGDKLRGLETDKNRYEKHIEGAFGNITPSKLSLIEVEQMRQRIAKTHSNGTVRNVLELMRRIINHGARLGMYPKPNWTIQLPIVDPKYERIEVLTPQQFRKLNEVWDNYNDRQVANLHKLIGWTGMRPSESMRLKWDDVDFRHSLMTKRNIKSNKTLQLRINGTALSVLLAQRELLDRSAKLMYQSPFVFPNANGGRLQWASYKSHFRAIREAAGIPETYRPNYCLRDTIASMMLSDGATLDEVGYQLGHEAGSLMIRRYARFISDAQNRITDRAESVLNGMLRNSNEVSLADYRIET